MSLNVSLWKKSLVKIIFHIKKNGAGQRRSKPFRCTALFQQQEVKPWHQIESDALMRKFRKN